MRTRAEKEAMKAIQADLALVEAAALVFAFERFDEFMVHMDMTLDDKRGEGLHNSTREWAHTRLEFLVCARVHQAKNLADAVPDYY